MCEDRCTYELATCCLWWETAKASKLRVRTRMISNSKKNNILKIWCCASIFVVVIVVVRPYSPNSSYLFV